jgi:hypothetical protein
MSCIAAARERLESAAGLAATLAAAYDAFDDMLPVLYGHAETEGGLLAAFVMSAAAAADGRDALAHAPSLPPYRETAQAGYCGETRDGGHALPAETADDAADTMAALAGDLVARLDAVASAAGARDREACQDAARTAQEIRALLAGTRP